MRDVPGGAWVREIKRNIVQKKSNEKWLCLCATGGQNKKMALKTSPISENIYEVTGLLSEGKTDRSSSQYGERDWNNLDKSLQPK